MNKATSSSLTAILMFVTAADCFAANPYIGTWKFNDAKSKMRPEVTRNSTITYAEQGDYIKVTMDGMNSGKHIYGVWVGKFDGKAYPVKGNPYHDAEDMRLINDHTLFIQDLRMEKSCGGERSRSQGTAKLALPSFTRSTLTGRSRPSQRFMTGCEGLTNRWSQPLAVVMTRLNFMKQFSMLRKLAAASGGSAPSR